MDQRHMHAIKKGSGRHRDPVDGDRRDERFSAGNLLVFLSLLAPSHRKHVSSSPFHKINYPLQESHYFQVIIILSIRFLFRWMRVRTRLSLLYLSSHLLYWLQQQRRRRHRQRDFRRVYRRRSVPFFFPSNTRL